MLHLYVEDADAILKKQSKRAPKSNGLSKINFGWIAMDKWKTLTDTYGP